MSVKEQLMKPGAFDLTLKKETPKAILDLFTYGQYGEGGFFQSIVVTPGQMPPGVGDAALLASARVSGLIRSVKTVQDGATVVSGMTQAGWLGDEDGKGHIIDPAIINDPGVNMPSWIEQILNATIGSDFVGDLQDPGGDPLAWEAIYKTPLQAFAYVVKWFSSADDTIQSAWRMNPNFTVDAGSFAQLWPSTLQPTLMVVRRKGGQDPTITAVESESLEQELSAEDYVERTYILARGEFFDVAYGFAATTEPVFYFTPYGDIIQWGALVDAPDVTLLEDDFAAKEQAKRDHLVQRFNVAFRGFDARGKVMPGDSIYVYDEVRRVVDESNQVYYRGELLYPRILRVLGMTWPIERGMGVYLRRWPINYDPEGDPSWPLPGDEIEIIDLTHYVQWETGSAQLEIGQEEKPITQNQSDTPRFNGFLGGGAEMIWGKYVGTCSVKDVTPTIPDYTLGRKSSLAPSSALLTWGSALLSYLAGVGYDRGGTTGDNGLIYLPTPGWWLLTGTMQMEDYTSGNANYYRFYNANFYDYDGATPAGSPLSDFDIREVDLVDARRTTTVGSVRNKARFPISLLVNVSAPEGGAALLWFQNNSGVTSPGLASLVQVVATRLTDAVASAASSF